MLHGNDADITGHQTIIMVTTVYSASLMIWKTWDPIVFLGNISVPAVMCEIQKIKCRDKVK